MNNLNFEDLYVNCSSNNELGCLDNNCKKVLDYIDDFNTKIVSLKNLSKYFSKVDRDCGFTYISDYLFIVSDRILRNIIYLKRGTADKIYQNGNLVYVFERELCHVISINTGVVICTFSINNSHKVLLSDDLYYSRKARKAGFLVTDVDTGDILGLTEITLVPNINITNSLIKYHDDMYKMIYNHLYLSKSNFTKFKLLYGNNISYVSLADTYISSNSSGNRVTMIPNIDGLEGLSDKSVYNSLSVNVSNLKHIYKDYYMTDFNEVFKLDNNLCAFKTERIYRHFLIGNAVVLDFDIFTGYASILHLDADESNLVSDFDITY